MRKFKNNRNEIFAALSILTQMGLSIAITMILCIAGGAWLDGKIGTSPLFLAVMTILGFGASVINIFKLTKRFIKNSDKKGGEKDGTGEIQSDEDG